jgi:hypothetical protein
LNNYPVTDFISIERRTGGFASPVWMDLDAEDYLVSEDDGTIQMLLPYPGIKNIRVTYKAGFTEIPEGLQLAVLRLVAKVYNRRNSEGFKQEDTGGARVIWEGLKEDGVNDEIDELIYPYRRIMI